MSNTPKCQAQNDVQGPKMTSPNYRKMEMQLRPQAMGVYWDGNMFMQLRPQEAL